MDDRQSAPQVLTCSAGDQGEKVLQCVPTVNTLIEDEVRREALDPHISLFIRSPAQQTSVVATLTPGELHFIVRVKHLTWKSEG